MITSILLLLALLQLKHWYIDFVIQTNVEIASKGIYGDRQGIMHSAKHGLGTMLAITLVVTPAYIFFAFVCGVIDFVVHYHVDWAKININKKYNYTTENPKFWAWLGADQLAHSLTYLGLVWLVV